jgi:hypothetical protein
LTWVDDHIYAAGGSHVPNTWAEFADQTGVVAILNLAPQNPTRFHGPPPETFLWLAVEDEAQAGIQARLLAGRFLYECVQTGRNVLLHSALGRHRTRWAFVAYRIYAGRSVQATLRKAASRPWLAPYHTDETVWNAYAAMLKLEKP